MHRMLFLDTTDHSWLAGLAYASAQNPMIGIEHAGWYQSQAPSQRHGPASIWLPVVHHPHFFLPSSKRDGAEGEEVGGWVKQSVGWRSEDKGRMDRCCCQDLSAVTNGCCKDEASKTLENSDVVNHRCVRTYMCVFFMCLSVCFSYCVGEWKRKCVHVCL